VPQQPFDPSVYVHSPAELARMHVQHAEFIQKHPGIAWGVEAIDKHVIPQRPGNMTILCGRPGAGKSSLLSRQAKHAAMDIAARSAQEQECVIYVTWEQTAEELEAYFEADESYTVTDYAWGRVSLDDVRRKAIKRAGLPLWVIGHSDRNVAKQVRSMSLDVVFQAIESMDRTYQSSPRPVLLCFDYAQLIPMDRSYHNRYEQVKAAIVDTKQLALRVGCPVMVAAQARREVDTYQHKIPQLRDAQESSGIEQHCDKFFGLWRPWTTEMHHSSFDLAGKQIPVEPSTLILQMCKQRNDNGSRTWVLHFSPSELRLAEMELRQEVHRGTVQY